MKKLLAIILTPFRLLKKLFVFLWSHKLTRVFTIVGIIVFGFHMYRTLAPRWSQKDHTVATSESLTEMTTTEATTSALSAEDIYAMVSDMVESRVAEELAKIDSTSTDTQVTQTTAQSVKAVPQKVTTAVTTTESTEDSNANVSEVTFLQGNDLYTVPCMVSADEALSYSTFCKSSGRDVYVQVPDYVTSVSISISFRDANNNLSEFSDFEELDLNQTENGTEAQYSIPDNPLRDDGYYEHYARFFGIFRLETANGMEYFSISY